MSRFNLRAVLAILGVGLALQANALILTAALTGDQEVPPVNTPAFGVVRMDYNLGSHTFDMTIRVFGISLTQLTASHIHVAPFGQNGPVIVPLGGPGDYVSGPGGTIERHITGMAFPVANEPDLLSRNTYVNLHTSAHPGGEIRGQLCVIPEPASLVALGVGVVGLALRRRRAK